MGTTTRVIQQNRHETGKTRCRSINSPVKSEKSWTSLLLFHTFSLYTTLDVIPPTKSFYAVSPLSINFKPICTFSHQDISFFIFPLLFLNFCLKLFHLQILCLLLSYSTQMSLMDASCWLANLSYHRFPCLPPPSFTFCSLHRARSFVFVKLFLVLSLSRTWSYDERSPSCSNNCFSDRTFPSLWRPKSKHEFWIAFATPHSPMNYCQG